MYLTGFADEAAAGIDGQIKATLELGWKNIEARAIDGTNLHDVPEETFEEIRGKLADAGISINCFGSAIANWSAKITDPPEVCYDQLKRAIPRMHKLGTKLIRIMSFNIPEDESDLKNEAAAKEVLKRISHLAKMAEDAGITLVHENCDNWGGRSYEHTLRLLEVVKSPALKLVFDTGNPVFRLDVRGEKPYKHQNSFEFYKNVREHVAYVHIKDDRIENGKIVFTFAGEGDGCVKEVLTDLYKNGYDGGISIEPHLAVVFHDDSVQSEEEVKFSSYVEYGRRLEKMVREIGWNPK